MRLILKGQYRNGTVRLIDVKAEKQGPKQKTAGVRLSDLCTGGTIIIAGMLRTRSPFIVQAHIAELI